MQSNLLFLPITFCKRRPAPYAPVEFQRVFRNVVAVEVGEERRTFVLCDKDDAFLIVENETPVLVFSRFDLQLIADESIYILMKTEIPQSAEVFTPSWTVGKEVIACDKRFLKVVIL